MSAPSTDLVSHGDALAVALAKHRAGTPLGAIEIDALVREIGYKEADVVLARDHALKCSSVLDAFAELGVQLEKRDDSWYAQTVNGHATGVSPWDAMQKVVKWQSVATQVRTVMSWHFPPNGDIAQ